MGACSMHLKARLVVAKAILQGYYWPRMHRDARDVIRKCDSCQIHSSIPKLPKTLMASIMAPWSFFQWGMDVLGPLPEAPGKASMPTHRTMMIKEGDGNEEEMRLNLDLLTKRREAATIWEEKYKTKVEQYYKKRVRPMSFKVGPYMIVEAYQNGSYKMRTMDDMEVPRVWHAINLRNATCRDHCV
nr:reverse transcriptase domain-containing protein [Tanacetum cinerariifolium]